MIRLRQVALAAHDLQVTVELLCTRLGLTVCYRDPGVAEFGLHNALMVVGDQFLEVVAPIQENTTAGRLLAKRGPDVPSTVVGYMAIYEVDDLDDREQSISRQGARIVWRGDFRTIRGRHLHPADVGGAIVSIDQPVPTGSWQWAGKDWHAHVDTSVVSAIAGIAIGADDPDAMRARWQRLGLGQSVRFQTCGPHGEGIDELELVATDRHRAGEHFTVGHLLVRLV